MALRKVYQTHYTDADKNKSSASIYAKFKEWGPPQILTSNCMAMLKSLLDKQNWAVISIVLPYKYDADDNPFTTGAPPAWTSSVGANLATALGGTTSYGQNALAKAHQTVTVTNMGASDAICHLYILRSRTDRNDSDGGLMDDITGSWNDVVAGGGTYNGTIDNTLHLKPMITPFDLPRVTNSWKILKSWTAELKPSEHFSLSKSVMRYLNFDKIGTSTQNDWSPRDTFVLMRWYGGPGAGSQSAPTTVVPIQFTPTVLAVTQMTRIDFKQEVVSSYTRKLGYINSTQIGADEAKVRVPQRDNPATLADGTNLTGINALVDIYNKAI